MLYDSQFIKIIRLQDLFGTPCGEGEILHYFDKAPDDVCCAKACNSTSDVQQLCSPELTPELWDAVLKSEEICKKDPLYHPCFPSRPLDELIERVRHHVEHRLEHGRNDRNFHKVFAAVLLRQLHEGDIIQFSGWAVNQADKEPHYLLVPDNKKKGFHCNGVLNHMIVQLKVTGEPKVEPSKAELSAVEPSAAEPSAADPAAVEPAAAEPAAVEPAAVEPAAVEPSAAEPAAVEPSAAEPSAADPAAVEPAAAEPAAVEPAAVEPSAAEPSKDDPQSSSYKKVVVQLEFSGCSPYGKCK